MAAAPALVVLLTGPSGCGKSSLAQRSGLPVLGLDSFYKDGDDPTLSRPDGPDGPVDWDATEAWDAERALRAVHRLAHERRVDVPRYDIARDRTVGTYPLDLGAAPAFVAEGIFAGELVAGCRDLGILGDALCLRQHAAVTFYRRLARDLRERRKSPPVLLRRGVALYRTEAETVTRQILAGTYPCADEEALYRIQLAAHARALAGSARADEPRADQPRTDEPRTDEPRTGEFRASESRTGTSRADEGSAGEAADDLDADDTPTYRELTRERAREARATERTAQGRDTDDDGDDRSREPTAPEPRGEGDAAVPQHPEDPATSPADEGTSAGSSDEDTATGSADDAPTRVLTTVDAAPGSDAESAGDEADRDA